MVCCASIAGAGPNAKWISRQVVGLGSAIAFTLSAMYIMGMDSKEIEGRISPYGMFWSRPLSVPR